MCYQHTVYETLVRDYFSEQPHGKKQRKFLDDASRLGPDELRAKYPGFAEFCEKQE